MQNHITLKKPFEGFIEASQLLSEEFIEEEFLPCEIIGLCFYKGEVITLLIKLSDGEVFSYIPPTVVQITKKPSLGEKTLSLKDLCFMNCPSDNIRINYIEALTGNISVFIKEKNLWLAAEYVCTIDFPKDNELLNMVLLDNGNFAFVPFHKMKFKELSKIAKGFRPYKKQREIYVV